MEPSALPSVPLEVHTTKLFFASVADIPASTIPSNIWQNIACDEIDIRDIQCLEISRDTRLFTTAEALVYLEIFNAISVMLHAMSV